MSTFFKPLLVGAVLLLGVAPLLQALALGGLLGALGFMTVAVYLALKGASR